MGVLPKAETIHADVARALEEDIGTGDITAELIPAAEQTKAVILCRENAVFCGRPWAETAFHQLDPHIRLEWEANEGDFLRAGTIVCRLQGSARSIVTAERTALNFLQTLSGTATIARRFADAVAGLPVKILDTRKTLPGLRRAQKYAVQCGGCENHRQGLFDAFLIKENHIAAAGSLAVALEQARRLYPDKLLELEVETLAQLQEALPLLPDRILLDNFDATTLRKAVQFNGGKIPLEASGNIALDNIRVIAETGIDYISLGGLTKHVQAIDYSLLFED